MLIELLIDSTYALTVFIPNPQPEIYVRASVRVKYSFRISLEWAYSYDPAHWN